MSAFNIYILHYTPLVKRKKHIEKEIKIYNYKPIFIETFNREELLLKDLKFFDTDKLKLSMISLINKHIEAWKQISNYENNDKDCNNKFGLIFEDDVILLDNFDDKLQNYIKQLPQDFDMLFIGDGCNLHIPESIIKHTINENNGNIVNVFKKGNYPSKWGGDGATRCSDSYLISKNCCNKILELMKGYKDNKIIINLPIDWLMNKFCRDLDLNVYWAEQTLTTQGTENGLFKSSHI